VSDKDYVKQLEQENAELRKRIEELEKRNQELERLVSQNSKNSSRPPSSDFGRHTKTGKPVKKTKRKRKPGAQKGHKPNLKQLVPEEHVTKFKDMVPEQCTCGCTELEVCEEPPLRFQTFDLPPIRPEVTEYVQHFRRCKGCGETVYMPLDDQIKRNVFGPGVLAIVGVMTGMLNTSKRKAVEVINEVFHIPMSLGGLSNCEARISEAMASPYDDLKDYVRSQDVAYADESSWRRGNRLKGWLWAMVTTTAAFVMIHANRTQEAARELLGPFSGILHSDRWCGYNIYEHIRQICWAHLKRDFQAISEAKGKLGRMGRQLLELEATLFREYHRARDGTIQWRTFQRRMVSLQSEVERLLQQGGECAGPLAGKCREILKHREHLWTFVSHPDVSPTNNAAERIVRLAVLWRKMSFGTQSQRGARYAERMLSVCATCRLQGRSIIDYIRQACHAHLNNRPVPTLRPE
jgi:transposase